MYPVIYDFGVFKIYSFGLMMGAAFLVANLLLMREARRRKLPEKYVGNITLIALVAGVVGSKLFSVIEEWGQKDLLSNLFSGAGLTFYGGLILATVSIMVYLRLKRVPFLRIADAVAPALILAYGIGRIGCQLAGDGDYGIPSKLPWAMTYPKGTVSTIGNQELITKYKEMYPGQEPPNDIPVHPAPVYETLAAIAIFGFLWSIRKRPMPSGMMFGIYLILQGVERLLVEFIRLNQLYMGLSQAQWIAVASIIGGAALWYFVRNNPRDDYAAVKTVAKK